MLTDETYRLVERLLQLNTCRSWFGTHKRHTEMITLLEQVANQSEPQAVSYIARFLFSDTLDVRVAACHGIHKLLVSARHEQLLHLYNVMQGWYLPVAWRKLPASKVESLVADESCRTSILGLASLHQNGYVRHAAVRQLSEIKDGSELLYLLIRLNDWVEPIQSDVRNAVENRLNESYLPHFIRYFSLVVHLLEFKRHDHFPFVIRLVNRLVRPEHDQLLAKALQSPSRKVRRTIARLALPVAGKESRRIFEYGLASHDAVIRLWYCREISSVYTGSELERILDRVRRDSYMPIRREAARIAAAARPEVAEGVWREALLDQHISIRELAQFELRRTGGFDLAQFYRDTLASHPDCLAAISGLGVTGDKNDLDALRSLLRFPSTSRRQSAVRALAKIGGKSVISEIVVCLRDDSPRVVREAQHQLRQQREIISGEELLRIVREDHRPHVRNAALEVIGDMSKWRSLPWLIQALSHKDSQTTELARDLIAAWFSPPLCNKVFTAPSDTQRLTINNAIADVETSVDASFLSRLQAWLHHS